MSFWNKLFAGPKPKTPIYGPGAYMRIVPSARVAMPPAKNAVSTNKPFAMQRTGDNSAEIMLYGDVVSERPTDWWGDPIEGQYIILSEFLAELKQVEDVSELTVRIHSIGGNVYDAITIHNRLKALKARVTVIIDGVAMSAGAIIACAGDIVQVFPGSLIMIHKCWGYALGNADDLRKTADGFDVADRSQAAIFSAKTGTAQDELLAMMAEETYLTGQEAIDNGFADELVEGSSLEVAASADRRTLFAGGLPIWVSTRKDGIPAALNIPTVKSEASATVATNTIQPAQTGSQNGGNTMAKTLEELRQENPELAEQLMAETRAAAAPAPAASAPAAPAAAAPAPTPAAQTVPAIPAPSATPGTPDPVAAERQRLQEIDAVAGLFDTETVNAAKYGDTACSAQEMVYRAAQKATQQGQAFLTGLEADTKASGVQKVGAAASTGAGGAGDGKNLTPEQLMAQGRADAKALNKTEKEEK